MCIVLGYFRVSIFWFIQYLFKRNALPLPPKILLPFFILYFISNLKVPLLIWFGLWKSQILKTLQYLTSMVLTNHFWLEVFILIFNLQFFPQQLSHLFLLALARNTLHFSLFHKWIHLIPHLFANYLCFQSLDWTHNRICYHLWYHSSH